jgi:hypothetical protein
MGTGLRGLEQVAWTVLVQCLMVHGCGLSMVWDGDGWQQGGVVVGFSGVSEVSVGAVEGICFCICLDRVVDVGVNGD